MRYIAFLILLITISCQSEDDKNLTNQALKVSVAHLSDDLEGFYYGIIEKAENTGVLDSVAFERCRQAGEINEAISTSIKECNSGDCSQLDSLLVQSKQKIVKMALDISNYSWLKIPDSAYHQIVKFDTSKMDKIRPTYRRENIILVYHSLKQILLVSAKQIFSSHSTPWFSVPGAELSSQFDQERNILEVVYYTHPIHLFNREVEVNVIDVFDETRSQIVTPTEYNDYYQKLLINCTGKSMVIIDYQVIHPSLYHQSEYDTTVQQFVWNRRLD